MSAQLLFYSDTHMQAQLHSVPVAKAVEVDFLNSLIVVFYAVVGVGASAGRIIA